MKKIAFYLISAIFIFSLLGACFPLTVIAEETEEISGEVLLVDDMEKNTNSLGGRCSVYVRAPSRIMFSKAPEAGCVKNGQPTKGLKISYDKQAEGGPYGNGGWCGYYTLVHIGKNYLDASGYKKLTFQIKGENGGENFKLGIADQQGEMIDDSTKTDCITAYLPEGAVTTEWQKAEIPLEEVFVDWSMLHSISLCFETECYEEGGQQSKIFIDDIQFEK